MEFYLIIKFVFFSLLISLCFSSLITIVYYDVNYLNLCTNNLAQNNINFQVNYMVITFNFPQNGNLTFECLYFDTFTLSDSTNTPNILMFSFNNTNTMNNYWLQNQNLQNTNFILDENNILFKPIIMSSCSSSSSCGNNGPYSCSSYCTSYPITKYYYNTTMPRKPSAAPKQLQRKKPEHPKYSEMISAALTDLKEKSGSSPQAILKYIIANYKVDPKNARIQIRHALKRGHELKRLVKIKGSYRLSSVGNKKAAKGGAAAPASPKKKKSAAHAGDAASGAEAPKAAKRKRVASRSPAKAKKAAAPPKAKKARAASKSPKPKKAAAATTARKPAASPKVAKKSSASAGAEAASPRNRPARRASAAGGAVTKAAPKSRKSTASAATKKKKAANVSASSS